MSGTNNVRRDTPGFTFFVKEFSLKNNIYESFETLQTLAEPYWDQLDRSQKELYYEKAKNPKRSFKDVRDQKCFQKLNTGNDENCIPKSRGHEVISKDIKFLLESNQCRQELHTDKFYFINTSTSEFAIAVFSLHEGIIKDMCLTITGSDNEWIEVKVLLKLMDFLRPLKTFPKRFFTNGNLTDDYDTFKKSTSLMKNILEKAGEFEVAESLKIFPLNYLLYHMKSFVKPIKLEKSLKEYPFNSLDTAQDCIRKDVTKFHPSTIACEDHEEKFETLSCCLSLVRKSAYIIAKYYSDPSKYTMLEGIHYPNGMRADYEIAEN